MECALCNATKDFALKHVSGKDWVCLDADQCVIRAISRVRRLDEVLRQVQSQLQELEVMSRERESEWRRLTHTS